MYRAISSTNFIEYKFQGRRPSIATLEDSTKKHSEFTCIQQRARTKTSSIRVFSSVNGETIVVKSPLISFEQSSFPSLSEFESEVAYENEHVQNELALMKKAYPDESPYGLDVGTYSYNYRPGIFWSYRLIMPFIGGVTFETYALTAHRDSTWLILFIAIARELLRIHKSGVIHGDVKGNNGLVRLNKEQSDFDVHFIDFDRAYLLSDKIAITTPSKGQDALYWAPERRVSPNEPKPSPDVKQDVFSYGYMVLRIIRGVPRFKKVYPTFFSSVSATQHEDPIKRPGLEEIISEGESLTRRTP